MNARRVAASAAIVMGVTVGGIAAGAFLVSPTMDRWLTAMRTVVQDGPARLAPMLPTMGLVAALLASAAAIVLFLMRTPAWGGLSQGVRSLAVMRHSAAPAMAMASAARGGGRAERTPRAVRALADAGTAPTEIAWRTGLPVDAVSMLLSLR